MRKIYSLILLILVSATAKGQEKSLDIYGHVMTDVIYNFDQIHPNWKDGLRPTKLPTLVDEYGPDGTIFFGVRQSRFGVKGYTPTKFGELKTQFEFEMYGTGADEGKTTLRLRHAYGQLGKWGAGQYWSPFMDVDIFPNSLEYWGPTGMVFFRNVQIRYMPIQGESFLTFALERPGASADEGQYSDRIELQNVRGKFSLPDFSAEYRHAASWGYVELAGILRYIAWEDLDPTDGNDISDNVLGWGLNLTSNIKLAKRATARIGIVTGEAIQNYMNDAPTDVAVESSTDVNKPLTGVPIPLLGLSAFVDINWNDRFSSTIGYSQVQMDNIDEQLYPTFQTGQYALANLIYYPAERILCGIELQYGARENKNEGTDYVNIPTNYLTDAHAVRVQASFKYTFGTTLYRKN